MSDKADQLDESDKLLITLTNAPFNLSFEAALAAVRNGTGREMVEQVEAERKEAAAELLRDVKNLGQAAGKVIAGATKGLLDNPREALIAALGDRVLVQSELLARAAKKREAAQSSESKTAERPLFFVCRKCLGAFGVLAFEAAEIACECGAAKFISGGPGKRDAETADCIDVTPLVKCGKLSVAQAGEAGTPSANRVILVAMNRNERNVVQRTASEIVAKIAESVENAVEPAAEYIKSAARAGAQVVWHAHYHNRVCGVERSDKGDFAKREATGDARFFGCVIARKQVSEADGSLLFAPVPHCTRCESAHRDPLPFWKLSRPMHHTTVAAEGRALTQELVATHFATCPKTGEPIMMIADESTFPAEVGNYSTPAPAGKVEQAMKPISRAEDIGGLTPSHLTTVAGVTYTQAFNDGMSAGKGSAPITSDPHPPGSELSAQWRAGFIEGRGARE